MTTMIERVSAALQARFRLVISEAAEKPFGATGVEMPGDEVWEGYARAAINAMREPTDAMVAAARRQYPYDYDVAESFPVMIAAALAE